MKKFDFIKLASLALVSGVLVLTSCDNNPEIEYRDKEKIVEVPATTPPEYLLLPGPALTVTNAGSGQLALTWEPVEGATGYYVFAGTTDDPEKAVQKDNVNSDTGTGSLGGLMLTGTSALITGLNNNVQYYLWSVSADASGRRGPKTGTPVTGTPSAPTAVPASNPDVTATANQGNIRLSWNPVSGAESYNLYVADTETVLAGTTPVSVVAPMMYNAASLDSGITKYFKVVAVNTKGVSTATAGVVTARTLANEALQPDTWSPEKTVQLGDTIRFAAAVDSSKEKYTVVYESSNGLTLSTDRTTTLSKVGGTLESVISVTASGGMGTLKVKFYDPTAIKPQETPVIASLTAVPAAVEVKWAALPGVTGYNVYRGTTPDFTPGTKLNSAAVTGASYIDRSKTGNTLSAGTLYYYKVAALNEAGEGPVSGPLGAAIPAVTPLVADRWTDGSLVMGGEQWFSIPITEDNAGTRIYLWGYGRSGGFGDKTYPSDVGLNRFLDNGETITETNYAHTLYWTSQSQFQIPDDTTGTLYFKAWSHNMTAYFGTFGIVYTATANTRPLIALPASITGSAATLTAGGWVDGTMEKGGKKWYKITSAGFVWLNGYLGTTASTGNGLKTLSVRMFAYNPDGSVPDGWNYNAVSAAWATSKAVTVTDGGAVYLLVEENNNYDRTSGTYGIAYTAANTKPAVAFTVPTPIVTLADGTWANGEFGTVSEIAWYKIDTAANTTYRVWMNNRPGSGGGGDGTKTGVTTVIAFNSDGTTFSGWTTTTSNAWGTAKTFTTTSAGSVYLRVNVISNSYLGTYGIVYSSTGTTRPE